MPALMLNSSYLRLHARRSVTEALLPSVWRSQTSAYVSIRQHIRQASLPSVSEFVALAYVSIRQHTSAYTSAYT